MCISIYIYEIYTYMQLYIYQKDPPSNGIQAATGWTILARLIYGVGKEDGLTNQREERHKERMTQKQEQQTTYEKQ